MLGLYLLKQKENKGCGICDSMIVCSRTVVEALEIRPDNISWDYAKKGNGTWAYNVESVDVIYIGIPNKNIKNDSIILASF